MTVCVHVLVIRMTESSAAAAEGKEKVDSKEEVALPSVEEILESHRVQDEEKAKRKPEAWRFFREVLHRPKFFLAPMVDSSVMPFRLLCKKHGTDLGVCPMIHAFAATTNSAQ